jgi:group I intron endonuclease
MNKYNNGKIYKIINSLNDEFYVGSTCNQLSNRMAGHRNKARKDNATKIYSFMRDIGINNFKIILIEVYNCESIEQLRAREQYWIDELKPSLNSQCALSQLKGNEYCKNYNAQNKDKIKEYYNLNKDKFKEYRDLNKDKRAISQGQPYHCEMCDCTIRHDYKSSHNKSKKHRENMQL